MDKNYAKLRYPSVDHIISEIKLVIKKHPHISLIRFYDDSFMAISSNVLSEFSEKWRKEIGVPFWVYGLLPAYVKREKMKSLIYAGMRRIRMGVQSGSERILQFYKRFNRPGLIADSMSIINDFSKFMSPPYFDIIVDNPIETSDDIIASLQMLYNAPRPFRLFVHSLRIIPDTEMEKDLAMQNIFAKDIGSVLGNVKPTFGNAMFYLLSVVKPPMWFYSFAIKRIKPFEKDVPTSPFFHLAYLLYKVRLFIDRIKALDFSILPGKLGWILWKLGIVGFIQRRRMNKALKAIGQI